MEKLKIVFLATLLAFCTLSSIAWGAGGIDSGGSDFRPLEDGSAWFLGDRSIRICFEQAPDFVLPAHQTAAALIESAFQTWVTYPGLTIFNRGNSPNLHLAVNHELLASCDGSEDLKIDFGVSNPEIEKARQPYSHPLALAYRQTVDLKNGWSKGFIWISKTGSIQPEKNFPNWTIAEHLQGILLHELGHVLGCEHVSGTIMDENFAALIDENHTMAFRHARLTQIDGDKILFYSGPLTPLAGVIGVREEEGVPASETFKLFTGREAHGAIRAVLRGDATAQAYVLDLSDDGGTSTFPIQFIQKNGVGLGTGSLSGAKIFKVVRSDGRDGLTWTYLPAVAMVIFGTIKTFDQSLVTISIEINLDSLFTNRSFGPIAIWYFGPGYRRNLFSTPVISDPIDDYLKLGK